MCSNCQNNEKFSFIYKKSGDDANVFEIQDESSFTIGTITDIIPEASFIIGDVGKTNAQIKLKNNSVGVITWALIGIFNYSFNKDSYKIKTIEENALLIVGDSKGYTVEEQEYAFHNKLLNLVDTDWEAYSLEIIKKSNYVYYAGQNFVDSSTEAELYTFKTLVANSEYFIVGYFDNFSGNEPCYFYQKITTLTSGESASLKITFEDNTDVNYDNLVAGLSKGLKATESRFFFKESERRSLTLDITVGFLPNVLDSLSSLEQVTLIGTEELRKALQSMDIYPLFIESSELKSKDVPEYNINHYSYHPSITSESIEYDFNFTKDALICCEYNLNRNKIENDELENIFFGVDKDGNDITNQIQCKDLKSGGSESISVKFSEIQSNWTIVVMGCVFCNDYPILPQCLIDERIQSYYELVQDLSGLYSLEIAISALLAYLV